MNWFRSKKKLIEENKNLRKDLAIITALCRQNGTTLFKTAMELRSERRERKRLLQELNRLQRELAGVKRRKPQPVFRHPQANICNAFLGPYGLEFLRGLVGNPFVSDLCPDKEKGDTLLSYRL